VVYLNQERCILLSSGHENDYRSIVKKPDRLNVAQLRKNRIIAVHPPGHKPAAQAQKVQAMLL